MNELKVYNTNNITNNGHQWQQLFNEFKAYADVSQKSIETYTKSVKQFLIYLQQTGNQTPTRETVIDWRTSLEQEHEPTTTRNYIMGLRAFFKYLSFKGYYPNITDKVKSKKITKGFKKDYLTSNQSHQLLEQLKQRIDAKGKRDFAIVALMITTGLRTIEVIRANIEDIRTLGDSVCLYIQGKGRADKTECVRIAPQVEQAIRAYLQTRTPNKQDPLFTGISNHDKGQRMTTRSISRIVKDNLRHIGLNSDKLTAHSLRHTAGTLALLNGRSIQEVQQALRHTNINTTMIYAHNIERAKNTTELTVANTIF